MSPLHSKNYIFAHISSSKHTLAMKIGTDKVFDATNPKMKSDFSEILAKIGISGVLQWGPQKLCGPPGSPNFSFGICLILIIVTSDQSSSKVFVWIFHNKGFKKYNFLV